MTFRGLAALAAVLVLAACGGGGGGGTASNGGPSGPTPDTLVLGDILVAVQGRLIRTTSTCDGTVCTISASGVSETIDLRDVDPSGPTAAVTDRQTRNGVQLGRITARDDGIRFASFGVWGAYNAGFSGVGSGTGQDAGIRFAIPASLGMESGSNPLTGSATWTGAMAGVRIEDTSLGAEVTGDATMTADLGAASLDLAFTNIAERFSGIQTADIRWRGVPMRKGSFRTTGLKGRFYGPDHEEAGGVFERSGIAGAFSLARQ